MDKTTQKYIILFNLIVSLWITLDFYIPGKEQPIAKLESFHSTVRYYSGRRSRSTELINLVEIQNGPLYRIGKLPKKYYKPGLSIKIIKSPLFHKVNEIQVLDKNWEYQYVGFIPKEIILIPILVAIVSAVASNRINHTLIDLSLVASTLFVIIASIVYILVY